MLAKSRESATALTSTYPAMPVLYMMELHDGRSCGRRLHHLHSSKATQRAAPEQQKRNVPGTCPRQAGTLRPEYPPPARHENFFAYRISLPQLCGFMPLSPAQTSTAQNSAPPTHKSVSQKAHSPPAPPRRPSWRNKRRVLPQARRPREIPPAAAPDS